MTRPRPRYSGRSPARAVGRRRCGRRAGRGAIEDFEPHQIGRYPPDGMMPVVVLGARPDRRNGRRPRGSIRCSVRSAQQRLREPRSSQLGRPPPGQWQRRRCGRIWTLLRSRAVVLPTRSHTTGHLSPSSEVTRTVGRRYLSWCGWLNWLGTVRSGLGRRLCQRRCARRRQTARPVRQPLPTRRGRRCQA